MPQTNRPSFPTTIDAPVDGHANPRPDTAARAPDKSTSALLEQLAAVTAQLDAATAQVANLTIALESNRRIGYAIGILMSRHGVTVEQAVQMLNEASNTHQRKVRDLAEDVILTGEIL